LSVTTESQARGAEALRQAILDEARGQARDLIRQAQSVAESEEAMAREEAEQARQDIVERAQREAAQEKQRAISGAQLDVHRQMLARREQQIGDVLQAAGERLEELRRSDRYGAVLHHLIVEAARAMGGGQLRVSADGQDMPLLDDEFLRQVARDLENTSLERGEPLPHSGGGILLASADGTLRYDNTFDGRLARSRDGLRNDVHRFLSAPE
jgi:V/A-type H+-transporting ATPase subunit E